MDNRTPEERFWVKVAKGGPDECWLWTAGLLGTGYGSFRVNGKTVSAHRFAYTTLVGEVPVGLVLDHRCHNEDPTCDGGKCRHRRCVNPAHLDVVTHRLNLLNSRHTLNHASATATHCPSGHRYDEANTAFDGSDRYCRTCSRMRNRDAAVRRSAEKRERYAQLRAAGLSAAEARSASKRLMSLLKDSA